MKTNCKAENEAFNRISKEAQLLSNYAWLVTIASDPQDRADCRDMLFNQWEYLQRVVKEALPEVEA